MALTRSQAFRRLCRAFQPLESSSSLLGSSRSYSSFGRRGILRHQSIMICTFMHKSLYVQGVSSASALHSSDGFQVTEQTILCNGSRWMSTQAKVPTQSLRQRSVKVTMLSPGFVYEPYKPREAISFLRRWFTPSGWRRTKEDVILELRNAYAIARLRKVAGYSKKLFYQEAVNLYKEINILIANGDRASLRKLVTENMFSTLKNELKRRESMWSSVYWELVQPVVNIRTLRARMIGVDKNNLDKAFIQLTIEFLTKQKFESYDSNGAVISGDKTKEVLVRDIWVFERSLFHPGARWRICARISL